MTGKSDMRGILYPTRLPSFHRMPAPAQLRELIRWFWIPRWNLAPGQTSRQEVLPFPASNLVVEPSGVSLAGPTTGISHRDLQGQGWGVGALLRPAAITSLVSDPSTIRDTEIAVDVPDLHRAVATAMRDENGERSRDRAVQAYAEWAAANLGPPDEQGLLANTMEEMISSDRSIVSVAQVAERLGTSIRGVQRLAQRHIGQPPLAVIRRYRLQEAAQRLREEPSLTIARVAAELGYADHAHLTTDFRKVLGLTPNYYRHNFDEEP